MNCQLLKGRRMKFNEIIISVREGNSKVPIEGDLFLPSDSLRQFRMVKKSRCGVLDAIALTRTCLLYTSPSPRDLSTSRMPSSA